MLQPDNLQHCNIYKRTSPSHLEVPGLDRLVVVLAGLVVVLLDAHALLQPRGDVVERRRDVLLYADP